MHHHPTHAHMTHACMATQSVGKASIKILILANPNLKLENSMSESHYHAHHTSSVSSSWNKKILGSLSGFTIYAFQSEGCCYKEVYRCAIQQKLVPTWVFNHNKSYNGGSEIQLVLDKCIGTFIAFYLSSQNSKHDEIDFEFSRNKFGQRFILQTNVFTGRK